MPVLLPRTQDNRTKLWLEKSALVSTEIHFNWKWEEVLDTGSLTLSTGLGSGLVEAWLDDFPCESFTDDNESAICGKNGLYVIKDHMKQSYRQLKLFVFFLTLLFLSDFGLDRIRLVWLRKLVA